MTARSGATGRWVIDTHAHLYPGYDFNRALDRAISNLDLAVGSSVAERWLLVADPAGVDSGAQLDARFDRIGREGRGAEGAGRWRVEEAEATCRRLRRAADGAQVNVLRGRQIATEEGLELLVFGDGLAVELPDRLAFGETLSRATSSAGLVIVPWGFGKWWFGRRELLLGALDDGVSERVFVGDSGGRPALGRRSSIFCRAEELGVGVLCGSDPLPLVGEEDRLGSSGLVIEAPAGVEFSIQALCSALVAAAVERRAFRRGAGVLEFARNQCALRLPRRDLESTE